LRFFIVFLNPTWHMLEQYLDYPRAASFQILSNTSFICHSTIQCYIA
jgi:hypothetical protein